MASELGRSAEHMATAMVPSAASPTTSMSGSPSGYLRVIREVHTLISWW